jgi:hypothetical protein
MVSGRLLSKIRLNYQCICLFAHPGHELAILNTLSQLNPVIHILTNGGGRNDRSRISYSETAIDRIAATQGDIWGKFSDLEAYRLLKDRLIDRIIDLTRQSIGCFSPYQNICIISDAFEGYNPIHDLAAVISQYTAYYLRAMGRKVIHLSFSPILAARNGLAPSSYNRNMRILRIPIDRLKLEEKIKIANEYLPLQSEINTLSNHCDINYETFFLHRSYLKLEYPQLDWHPFWEKYSQEKVSQGHYTDLLTYQDNFYPIYQQLSNIAYRNKSA